MEYSPTTEKDRGCAIGVNTTTSPPMISRMAVRSFTTPLENTTAQGPSRRNDEYSGSHHQTTATNRPFNWKDVYPTEQHNHVHANQEYTSFVGRHTDPGLQPTSRFSSFIPDSTRSQPDAQGPARLEGHQTSATAASQVTYEPERYDIPNSPARGKTSRISVSSTSEN